MHTPTPAWYDAQYNNRARIPQHPAILKHWADASAAAYARPGWALDLAYGNDASERVDVLPATRPGSPVLVYIHGGYWRALSRRDQSFVAPPFVDAGAMVVLVDYALCPAVSVEHIVGQVAKAVGWVRTHAAEHGGDPARIVAAGHSAGGHLAAMLLAQGRVNAALSISGLYELEPLRHAPFLADDLALTEASARALSPAAMRAPRGRLASVVGGDESEEFLRQADLIAQVWGPEVVIANERIAQRNHMDVLNGLAEPDSATHRLGLRLLGLRS